MPKINEQDRISMVKHLKDLSGKAIIASTKHSKNIQKQIDHSIELTKFIKEDRSKIERLNNVIDMKQREIGEPFDFAGRKNKKSFKTKKKKQ